MFNATAEMNLVNHFGPLEFPGIAEAQPFIWIFLLPALRDDLAEQAEIVTDAIPDCRNGQRGHAFHEAGRKPSETAIAERGIGLAFAQVREVDAEIAQRRLEHGKQPHIVQPIGEQPANQEFEAEIINALGAGVVALLFRGQPMVHNPVTQGERRCLVPVVPCRHTGILADGEPELGENGAFDLSQRKFIDWLTGRCESSRERLIWQAEYPGCCD